MRDEIEDRTYFDAGYNFVHLRKPTTQQFYKWPEAENEWKYFRSFLREDQTTGITYSRGREWHLAISDEEDGAIPNVYYRVNSDGHHWYEFEHNPDVVALGCSTTAGMGIPIEYTWPSLYRHITGETVNNIARPGNSLARMVYIFFHHIKHYGLPKKIFVLLGDPVRYWFQGRYQNSPDAQLGLANEHVIQFAHDAGVYVDAHSGRPWVLNDSLGNRVMLSPDLVVAENLRAFEHLLFFAEAMGIEVQLQLISSAHADQFEEIDYPVVRRIPFDYYPVDDTQKLFWKYGFDFKVGVAHDPHDGLWPHLSWVSAFLGRHVSLDEQTSLTCWAEHLFDHTVPKCEGRH